MDSDSAAVNCFISAMKLNCKKFCLQIWKDLMPLWMWNNVLDQLVLPKLQNDVELWDPLTDSVPLHSWLHPWLPFLGQQLEIVYPTIRYQYLLTRKTL